MAAYEARTGGKALAIAHNGNGSNGRMFPIIESFTGKKIDREYAENRRRWGAGWIPRVSPRKALRHCVE